MQRPLVSLILVVKDGMPYLPEAVASVAAQTYPNVEVVAQDGASTDGTVEYLQDVPDVQIELVSEPDGGIGDAYNRAVTRCSGHIVGTIDADNLLEPDAVERVVDYYATRPQTAAVYGGSHMVDADGTRLYPWMPADFDLLRLLSMELVPPFAVSFFSRSVCGPQLRFDESLKTCADFDLWLRLSPLPIERVDAILGSTRLSSASMTRRPETYDQYIADKSTALDRYFAALGDSPVHAAVRRRASAGLYLWSAESVYDIEGRRTAQFETYLERARAMDAGSPWLAQVGSLPAIRPEPEPESDEEPPPAEPPVPPTLWDRCRARLLGLGARS
jgi:glycosyltransferase